jgi:hypothetical protein
MAINVAQAEILDGEQRARFLEVLAEHGNLGDALSAAVLPLRRALALRAADQDFAAGWDAAIQAARDRLETVAWHRAIEGIEEPHFYGGEKRGAIRRCSDRLLQILIKAERPEKFADPAKGVEKQDERRRGGILVLPGPADPEEWVKEPKKHHRRLMNGGPD